MSNPLSRLAQEELLTPEVLFAQPGLRPTLPSQFKFSPDGRFVTYLKGTEDAPTTLDLWHFDRVRNEHQLLVRASTSMPTPTRALPSLAMQNVRNASANGNSPSASHTTNGWAMDNPSRYTLTGRRTASTFQRKVLPLHA